MLSLPKKTKLVFLSNRSCCYFNVENLGLNNLEVLVMLL